MIIADFNVDVLGYTGVINSVGDVLDGVNFEGSIVQLLDARGIAGRKHILHAINQSILAFKRGTNFANDLGVEICLRASSQRQISRAFDLLGLKEGSMDLCAVVINGSSEVFDYLDSNFTRDDDVLLPVLDDLVNFFDLNPLEVSSYPVEDIIIDKISKLAVDY